MEQNIKHELILGWLAVLKISDWIVNYTTFEGNFSIFHGEKYLAFLNTVASAPKEPHNRGEETINLCLIKYMYRLKKHIQLCSTRYTSLFPC